MQKNSKQPIIINTQDRTKNSLKNLGKSPRTSKLITIGTTLSRPFSTSLYTPQIICYHLSDFLFHPRNFNRRERYKFICLVLSCILWYFGISIVSWLPGVLAEGYSLAMDPSEGSGGTGGTPGGSESGGNPGGPSPEGSDGEKPSPEPSSNKRRREPSDDEQSEDEPAPKRVKVRIGLPGEETEVEVPAEGSRLHPLFDKLKETNKENYEAYTEHSDFQNDQKSDVSVKDITPEEEALVDAAVKKQAAFDAAKKEFDDLEKALKEER